VSDSDIPPRTAGEFALEMATPEDAAELQRLLTTVFSDNFIGYTIYQSPQSAAFLQALIERPESNYIRVIRNENEIIAFSQSSVQEHAAHLGFIGVRAEHEGKGLANALLEDLIEYVRQCEKEGLTLDVFEDNERPYRWYKKRGF